MANRVLFTENGITVWELRNAGQRCDNCHQSPPDAQLICIHLRDAMSADHLCTVCFGTLKTAALMVDLQLLEDARVSPPT
jgi:hypothetical protein